ncbi:MAG: hypothetical protein WCG83_07335 [Candidatus Peregrinibacteria bacterium]
MLHSLRTKGLYDAYSFPGCITRRSAQGVFGDPHAIVLTLVRRGKKRCAVPAVMCVERFTTARSAASEISPVEDVGCTWKQRFAEWTVLLVAV